MRSSWPATPALSPRCSVSLVFFDAALDAMSWLQPPARPARTTADHRAGDTGAADTGAADTGASDTGASDTGAGDTGGEKGGDEGGGLAHEGSAGVPADTSWVEEALKSGSEGASEAMAAGLAHLLATELPAVAAEIDMEALATAQVSSR